MMNQSFHSSESDQPVFNQSAPNQCIGSNQVGENHSTQIDRVIAVLRADLPHLFDRDISYDIYTQDIYFRDPVNTFKGKFNYRIIFWTLRFHARLFFTQIFFDLHSVSHSAQDIIFATWTVRGTLRLPWKPNLLFNGSSTYKLNAEGLIYEHIDTWDRPPLEIVQQFFRKG